MVRQIIIVNKTHPFQNESLLQQLLGKVLGKVIIEESHVQQLNLLFCFPIKMNHFYNKPLILFSIITCDPSCYLNISTCQSLLRNRMKWNSTCKIII